MTRSLLSAVFFSACTIAGAAEPTWRAGTARAVITPEQPMWMAGYGGRDHPADGKQADLLIRALALEDAQGRRGVILSSDTLGISQPIYEAVVARMKSQHGLDRSQIMLHASHTHCGPVLKQALYDTYPLDDAQRALIEAYSAKLIDIIVTTLGEALKSLEPVTLSRGQGVATFAVNRRNNREADVPALREANQLVGPVDHSVPVLAVRRRDGSLKAVVFAYACHNTVMDFYKWFGDYAGVAQFALEDRNPGVTAMFVMGCGADQNPVPRRKLEFAEQYGAQLADAVQAALKEGTRPLSPRLQTAIELTPLAFDPLPPREQLEQTAAEKPSYRQRWAARMVKLQSSGDALPKSYPYPVQAWRLGEQLWINLGGEVVVDYSLKFKGEFGYDTWVTGYSNDVMAYIPSHRVLLEGGYEGQSSMMVYGQPAERWAPDVEERLTNAVRRVVSIVMK